MSKPRIYKCGCGDWAVLHLVTLRRVGNYRLMHFLTWRAALDFCLRVIASPE